MWRLYPGGGGGGGGRRSLRVRASCDGRYQQGQQCRTTSRCLLSFSVDLWTFVGIFVVLQTFVEFFGGSLRIRWVFW